MKKVTGKILSMVLCLGAITSIAALPASAENVTDTAAMSAYATRSSASVYQYPNATESTTDVRGVAISPRGANLVNKKVSIGAAEKYSYSFKMDNAFSGDHNAFNIVVSDAGGSYSAMVLKSDGSWSTQFPPRSGNSTMSVDGCVSGVTYTVHIENEERFTINPTISITSYVK